MKKIKTILAVSFFCLSGIVNSAEPLEKSKTAKNYLQNKKIKSDQYTITNNKTKKVLIVKMFEGLKLSQDCFKKDIPNCEAYSASLKKPVAKPADNMKSPYHNNLASIYCELIGGENRIAKSPSNDETDFCEFKDGSLVSSWSAYYKTNPVDQKSQ